MDGMFGYGVPGWTPTSMGRAKARQARGGVLCIAIGDGCLGSTEDRAFRDSVEGPLFVCSFPSSWVGGIGNTDWAGWRTRVDVAAWDGDGGR